MLRGLDEVSGAQWTAREVASTPLSSRGPISGWPPRMSLPSPGSQDSNGTELPASPYTSPAITPTILSARRTLTPACLVLSAFQDLTKCLLFQEAFPDYPCPRTSLALNRLTYVL